MDSLILNAQNDAVDDFDDGLDDQNSTEPVVNVRTNDQGQQETTLTIRPKTKVSLGGNTVLTVSLTQEQTAMFEPGNVRVQVNWKTSDNHRRATNVVKIPSFDNLYEEEI